MSTSVHTLSGTLVGCLLDMTMVSSNHTIKLKIDEERQRLVANTNVLLPGLLVDMHMNTSCPSNIAFIDKRCSSFRYLSDMCNF